MSAVPIIAIGYTLNKQDLRVAIHIRCGWKICTLTVHVEKKLSESVLNANREIHISEAQIMKEVCHDIQIEHTLFQISENKLEKSINTGTMQVWMFLPERSGQGSHTFSKIIFHTFSILNLRSSIPCLIFIL